MTRIGGVCASMVRICTGEVWVRSTGGAPSPRRRQIERVLHLPRGVVGRDVEGAKLYPVVLDVGAFGDRAAHGAEDRGDLLDGAADRVDQPGRPRRAAAA